MLSFVAQYLLSPGGLARLVPYAEVYNVHVGIEIHNPESPVAQSILDYVDVIEKTGSKYIGFVPDFGCFATKPNKPYWDRALAGGATEDQLKRCACPALFAALNSMYGFVQFRKSCTKELEGLKKMMLIMSGTHSCPADISAMVVGRSRIFFYQVADSDFQRLVSRPVQIFTAGGILRVILNNG